jgi:riboflavin kinase/FMN adenylyltransferase
VTALYTLVDVNGKIYPSLTNVGKNPTFAMPTVLSNLYLFDLRDDLYSHQIKVEFIHKLRDEIQFSNPDNWLCKLIKIYSGLKKC